MTNKEIKELSFVTILFLLFALGIYVVRQENKVEAEQVRAECVRESYEMAKKHGETPKVWERECLQHKTQEALDRLSMQYE